MKKFVIFIFLCFAFRAEAVEENLSLHECLLLALNNHPSLRQAKGATRSAAAELERIKANNRVTANLTGSVQYNGNYDYWDDSYHREGLGLSASKTLFDNGRNRLQKEMQNEILKGSRQNERQKQVKVTADAKRAYYNLVLKILNREVEQEKVQNLEEHLKSAKGLYEVGQSAYIDVTHAESNLAEAKVSMLKAENDILLSQEALRVAMGLDSMGNLNLKLSSELTLPELNNDLEYLLTTALNDRPDFLQAMHILRAREINVKDASRSKSPTVTGEISTSINKREGSRAENDYSIGVSLRIPLADGGAAEAAIEAAKSQLEQQNAEIDTLRHQITYDVRSAALSLLNAVQRVQSSQTGVKYSEENLTLAQGRYEVGAGNTIELSDAVSQLATSRYTFYQALYDAQVARADLDEAMGHLPSELEQE